MQYHPHAPHPGRNNRGDREATQQSSPSHVLHPQSERVQKLLEELDDVIFLAIKGDGTSLELAHSLWPEVVEAIGWELVEESREQYLRYATDVTRLFDDEDPRDPAHAVAALEIIELLTRE